MTEAAITHYTSERGNLYCLTCGPNEADAEPSTSEASDYDDMDCCGARLSCESCCDDLFPEAVAELEAEYDRMHAEFRRGGLNAYRRVTEADLDAYEPGDPKRISLAREIGR